MLLKTQGENNNPLWRRYNFLSYLDKLNPELVNGQTIIYDETAKYQPTRSITYNIVIGGDSVSSVDFITISGTISGWFNDGTGWIDSNITTGLVGTTLTFQSSVDYSAFWDDNNYYIMTSDSSLVKLNSLFQYESKIDISTPDIDALLTINDSAPLSPFGFDDIGYLDTDQGFLPIDFTGTATISNTFFKKNDWPLTPHNAPALKLDNALSEYIQMDISLNNVAISNLYGSTNVISDFNIVTFSNTIETNGVDCSFARIDLSNGSNLVYQGDALDQVIDVNNGDHGIVNVIDLSNAQSTQNDYQHIWVYGYSEQYFLTFSNVLYNIPNDLNKNTINLTDYTVSNEFNSGVYFDTGISSPLFRTNEIALFSNEEFNRLRINDRILIPRSYDHIDDNFVGYRNTGNNNFIMNPINIGDANKTNRFEALITDYISSRMIAGNSANANRAFGFQFGDIMAIHSGTAKFEVDCGLNLAARTEPFIAIWEWSVNSAGNDTENINFYITEVDGTVLFASEGNVLSGMNRIVNIDTIGSKGNVLNDPFHGTFTWIKRFEDTVLQNWWIYPHENSYMLQDIANNYNTVLITTDIATNQGVQSNFNPLQDGYFIDDTLYDFFPAPASGEGVELPFSKDDFTSAIIELEVYITADKASILNGRGAAGGFSSSIFIEKGNATSIVTGGATYTDIEVNGVSLGGSTTRDELYNAVGISNWKTIKIYDLDLTGLNVLVNEINLGYNSSATRFTGHMRNIKIDLTGDLTNDAEYLGYGPTPWVDILGSSPSNDGTPNITDQFSIDDKYLAQYPYNGLDIYGNVLTFPRPRKIKKAINYTK